MSSLRSSLLAVFAASVLILGASACSGDDDKADDAPAATSNESDETPTEADGAGDSTGGEDGTDAAFGVSREEIAETMEAAMPDVEKVDVDGSTLTLHVPDGSLDDPMNQSHCRIATEVVGIGDTVLLALPDGEYECGVDDQDE